MDDVLFSGCKKIQQEWETRIQFILNEYEEEFIDMCILHVPYFDKKIKTFSKYIRKLYKSNVIDVHMLYDYNVCIYSCAINIRKLVMVLEEYINNPILSLNTIFSPNYKHECLTMYKDMHFCLQELLRVLHS